MSQELGNIEELNRELTDLGVDQRIKKAVESYGDIVVASSFGLEDVAILDIVYRELGIEVPVFFLDTLYHFDETLDLVNHFTDEYGLDLSVYKPVDAQTRDEFEDKYGEMLWEEDVEKFHELTKLSKINEALDGRDAWITGIRREQSETRRDAEVVEWDDKHGLVKVNPLVDWSLDDVWGYIEEHDVPYNPLHDDGYLSIGDEPLTEPVGDDEDSRKGRWKGTDKTECGLHE